ncbi:MAG: ORF6N domain-containing protein [Bacteroidales bacterium]|nr:ORF6N domain-containing protein [Bacteroidales bacterium]MBQ1732838.1 ORF6N domain-containing protein [Bacteroidales bacterium]MBQ2574209.1 ORF6N domain-containing protein [Bacteroidales bacterium]
MTDSLISSFSSYEVEELIFTIRDKQVMIDYHLAQLYGVETKVLNQQVKRNIERFPERFRFQLTDDERDKVVTNCDHLSKLKFSKTNPYAFTEQGVAMLSAVLRSETAVAVSVRIIDAFVEMRRFLSKDMNILKRIDNLERSSMEANKKFDKIFSVIESGNVCSAQGIFFNGQVFDAYIFVTKLIRSATRSIVLIDNYVDESVLLMLDKREPNVFARIYTQNISPKLDLDMKKHNSQYEPIDVVLFREAHDRFLLVDDKVYHIGASLKDLGKKWFAFTLMNDITAEWLVSKIV